MHMAIGAVVNAAWDLASRRAGLPLWQYLASLTPEELVDQVDFRYITDALCREEALDIVRQAEPGRADRVGHLLEHGYPAYTTSAGWLGYDDDEGRRLARESVADGFTLIKLKVGADLEDDLRRVQLVRETVGPDIELAIDANQRWDVDEAIAWVNRLAPSGLRWIEEPTSTDDVLGHGNDRTRGGADRGRHRRARRQPGHVQATASGRGDLGAPTRRLPGRGSEREPGDPVACRQVRGARVPARRRRRPVRTRAAPGDGRLRRHQRPADGRVIEFVDHLHEHFVDPAVVKGGRYQAPTAPGFGARMHPDSVARFRFPDGPEWRQ